MDFNRLQIEDAERRELLQALGNEATQCPACGFVIIKNGGDDQMMCGCEAKPAGGTMEKALRGGGCGHQFNFRTGAPLGEGRMGAPINERQWKFMPDNPAARIAIERNLQPIPQRNQQLQQAQVRRQPEKKKPAVDVKNTKPVPFVVREPLEIDASHVERMVTPMALPEELNLLQVLKGVDERPQCSYCFGSGRGKRKDGKMSRRHDSSNESEEGKLELPLNTISIVESNPFIIDSLKEIFDDLNPETTRNNKVRSIMMIKDIDPKTRQQAVMAVMQGKKITFAGLDDNNDDKNEGKKEKEGKMNEDDAFLDSIVSDWELEEQQLERSHSSYATWLRESRDGNFDIFDEKTASTLEEAYSGGPGAVVQIKGPYSEYIIDLQRMQQTNIYTEEVLNVIRLPGNDEGEKEGKEALENARDARIVVLIRGASLEEEFEEAIEDEEIASWIYDIGGGNWDIFHADTAQMLESNIVEGKEFVDLFVPNINAECRVNLNLMSMTRLQDHQGPAIGIRRLGGDIETKEEKEKKKLNTRGQALKRRRNLLRNATPSTGVGARVVVAGRQPTKKKSARNICPVCTGSGRMSCWLTKEKAQEAGDSLSTQRDEKYDCLVCYGDGEYCMSVECGKHYYCGDCLRGSLEAMLNTGQFPAFCPQCRVDSGSDSSNPVKIGKIEENSLSFLQQRGVISLEFFYRFLNGAAQARAGMLHDQGGNMNNNNNDNMKERLGVDGDDVRGIWRLKVRSWNCRNLPHSRAGSKIVHKFVLGEHIEVKKHIKKDWCLLSGPENLKGKYVKLRTMQSRPRGWVKVDDKKAKAQLKSWKRVQDNTDDKKKKKKKISDAEKKNNYDKSFTCPGKCGTFLLREHESYEKNGMGEFYEHDNTVGLRMGQCPNCKVLICKRCGGIEKDINKVHMCPKAKVELNDKASLEWMRKICKRCPGCGNFVQKTEGCHIMMCGTNAHGKVSDALRNGGCACVFNWNTLKPCHDGHGYTGADGKWHKGAGPVTDRQVLLHGKKK